MKKLSGELILGVLIVFLAVLPPSLMVLDAGYNQIFTVRESAVQQESSNCVRDSSGGCSRLREHIEPRYLDPRER